MAIGQVWISDKVAPLFLRLRARLHGFTPIINVFTDEPHRSSAALHQPTLYPELNVPAARNGDWGEVARGVAHLLSALDGVPELRVHGTADDKSIAVEVNSELQTLAAVKEAIQPKPEWVSGIADKLLAMILNPPPGTLGAEVAPQFRTVG